MMIRTCVESKDKRYRYNLTISWNSKLPRLLFIMLNPSTADKSRDDQTSKKCMKFADRNGFGSITIVNLFAYRATDPYELLHIDASVSANTGIVIGEGESCAKANRHIYRAAKEADKIIVAWGSWGMHVRRDVEVLRLLDRRIKKPLWCFAVNRNGTPKHPLYVPDHTKLIPYSTNI
jgi:hypothetical protein